MASLIPRRPTGLIPSGPRSLIPSAGVSGPPAIPPRHVTDAIPIDTPPRGMTAPDADQPFDWRPYAVGAAGLVGGGMLGAGVRALLGGGDQAPPPDAPPVAAMPPAGAMPPAAAPPAPVQRGMVPDEIRRRQFLRQQAVRHRNAIAQNPAVWESIVEQYDTGAKAGGHIAGARATQGLQTELLAQDAAQRAINVQNAAKQFNVARQMGVPRGWVMAHEDVTQALGKGDMATASAKAAMYAHMYGPTWVYASQQITSQNAANQMAQAKAAEAQAKNQPQPDAVESIEKMAARIDQMPPGPTRMAAIESMHRARLGGANADQKAVQASVRAHYQPLVRGMLANGVDSLTPEQRSELAQIAANMGYGDWRAYTGSKDTPETQRAFRDITGRPATWAQRLGWGD